jgi:hypothetical protein
MDFYFSDFYCPFVEASDSIPKKQTGGKTMAGI